MTASHHLASGKGARPLNRTMQQGQGQTSSGRARRRAGSQELTKRQKGAGTGDSVDGKRHSGGAKRDHGGRPCSIERLKRANDLRGSLL